MIRTSVFLLLSLSLVGLSACYTPRDVRPGAVVAAKESVEKNLPPIAASLGKGGLTPQELSFVFERYLAKHPAVYGMAFAPVPADSPAL